MKLDIKIFGKNLAFVKIIGSLIFFFLINLVSFNLMTGIKFDLTSNKLFTVSGNTINIIKGIQEPINVKLFFSNSLSKDIPQIREYEKRVRELLINYKNISDSKINLEILDPKPFTDLEDLATLYGLQGLQLNQEGEKFYFGAVISNSVDDTVVVPFFDVARERFLEYDLTKTIFNLANTERPKIGLITALPFIGGVDNSSGTANFQQPFYLYTKMQELFDIEDLSVSATNIPDDIDQLLVIHPKKLTDETLYAIDQFVLSGRGAIFFVDPFSEYEKINTPSNQRTSDIPESNLERIFNKWGFSIEPGMIVGDVINGRKVSLGNTNDQKIITYILWLALQDSMLSRDDIITSNLDYVFFKSSGSIINLNINNGLNIAPLVKTSKNSMLVERFKMQFRADPEALLNDFRPSDNDYTLGARINGSIESAYSENDLKELTVETKNHIKKNANINILVYADTDIVTDSTWISKQDMFGRDNSTPIADNGRMIINSLESMSGGQNMIGLRGRGTSNRPFTVVEELQKNAELAFREQEISLQLELEDTEKNLKSLQSSTAEGSILDEEQSNTIEAFNKKISNIRKELREVQRELNQDIKDLETNLKLINIWLMPILVLILFSILKIYALNRRKKFNNSIGRSN